MVGGLAVNTGGVQGTAPGRDRGRRGAWVFGGGLALLLAALMFFSGTIYQYNLPRVKATTPQNGTLEKKETLSGYAEWETIENIYAPIAGTVARAAVKKGETVAAGQPLLQMSYDRDEAERKLRELDNSRAKLEVEIANIHLNIEKTKRAIANNSEARADAQKQYEKASGKSTTSNELALLEIDIRKAERTLADTLALYESGGATEREVTQAQDSLEVLGLQRETTLRSIADQQDRDADTLETLLKSAEGYEKSIADAKADLAAQELSLKSKDYDLAGLALSREPYERALADYAAYASINAPNAGTVLSVNAEAGQKIGENAVLISIGVGKAFLVDANLPLDNNFVFPGDACELSNTARTLTGTVISLTPGERGKTATVSVVSDAVSAGETFDIVFTQSSAVRYTLVPNGALNQDSDGYYVNLVKRRDGLLGKEFYLERLDVFVGDSDSGNTVITQGIMFIEPIALTSDKPVAPGDVIFLTNTADFFQD
ncbi:MAG: HlyD family secretion protein [Clostridiales bacterium]|jgi:biotin carboxyl carrier protein|nr:HlyD family secretion protein [Clostridiales bacterium]